MTVLEKYVQQRREQVEEKRKSASPTAKAVVETKQLEEYLNDLDLPKNQKNEATAFGKNIQKHAVQAEKEKKEDEERDESKIEMYRNLSSLGIQIANNISHKFLRCDNFNIHYWLQQHLTPLTLL